MSEIEETATISKGAKIVGWIMTILPVLIFIMSASFKFIQPGQDFVDGIKHLGWELRPIFILGFVEVACAIIYLIPRTSVLGAILMTAYMGGAITTHARIGEPFIAQILIGMMIWGGLYFRDLRIRRLLPLN